jgi:hypothetical protein
MTNPDENGWRTLCELASKERDPEKLYALVEQLNRALEDRAKKMQDRTPSNGRGDPAVSREER